MNKTALIFGADGQDGSFLKELLLSKNYHVMHAVKGLPFYSAIMFGRPDEIYNFAGISNVINPFEDVDGVFETNAMLPQRILELILKTNKGIKFFQASSCLMFGRDKSGRQNEDTPFSPLHPYGAAKLYAHNMVNEFRKTFGMFACSGIFFNHESERRKPHFFSRKITIAAAKKEKIKVGDMSALRDIGYAKDYVEAAYLMMQNQEPKDYVIGSGTLISMKEFAEKAFEYVGEDYNNYVEVDPALTRKNDTEVLCADITKIKNDLGWQPKTSIDEMIKKMIDHDKTF